jgi:hypothetical protein
MLRSWTTARLLLALFSNGLRNSASAGPWCALNVSFQYHIFKFLWPEFEVNYTHWPNGENDGKNQVFLTPGLIVGRIPLFWRFKALIGVGYRAKRIC